MQTQWLLHVPVILLLGYLVGSLSAAIITCKLMGLTDPRSQGSGNPGATNVLRTGNKKAAAITLTGDALKGLLAVLLTQIYLEAMQIDLPWLPTATGLAAFIGHLYPIFFRFKGGKGVATACGLLLGISLPVFTLTALTWLITAWVSKYSALAALSAFTLAPLYAFYLIDSQIVTVILIIMSILIFWRHRSNIQRLYQGTETKIGNK